MSRSNQQLAKLLRDWADYYVKHSQSDYNAAEAALAEENVQLRIAQAIETDRRSREPDYGVGWGAPTPEQQFEVSLAKAKLKATEKYQILVNNMEMRDYIQKVTEKDL